MKYARYIVGIPDNRILYKGNVRIFAWLLFNLYKFTGAEAFDCGEWIIEPASWLKCVKPDKNYFDMR